MAGNPTTTAIGTVTITATSIETNALFKSVQAAVAQLPAADVKTYSGAGFIPPPTGSGQALVLSSNVTGNVVIPVGYAYVVAGQGSTANLSGGTGATTIVGDAFTYTGNSGKVVSGNGDSTIFDGGLGADIVVGSAGRSTVTAGAANQTVHVGEAGSATITASGTGDTIVGFSGSNTSISALGDNEVVSIAASGVTSVTSGGNNQTIDVQAGASAQITTDGTGDTVNLGSPGAAAAAAARSQALAAAPVFTNVIKGQAGLDNTYNITDAGSVNEVALGTADTVNASAGISTIFGLVGDDVVASGLGRIEFVGGAGVSTVFGGAANATVFATTAQVFDAGSAQSNVFVGGTGVSTVNAGAGGGGFFGGTNGDRYNFGTGGAQAFVGLGGADTLNGGAGTVAPVIFATGAEHMTLTASTQAVTLVGFANGGVIDASATNGKNAFFAGYGIGGNQTLIGSAAAGVDSTGAPTHDLFVAGANPLATATSIVIDNWHLGDTFYLTGFSAADNATMDAAIVSSLPSGGKGDLSFTLGDKTTITFVGNHPTNFDAPTNLAYG